ncbi:hypothetical protein IEQ34_018118 [Dendrobium chrysotoxum]|uniref:Uncharacterized protein n=1 Tax=Dendrobium chrysotoxum TaxID=161865 RepID=A0AAV7FVZ7_DENCH|nr:hypothetical protein IEQ34_018118 [Dendrobium chrysotoxum]
MISFLKFSGSRNVNRSRPASPCGIIECPVECDLEILLDRLGPFALTLLAILASSRISSFLSFISSTVITT